MAVPTFSASGSKATTPAKLSKEVFGLEVENHQLVKQAYDTYLSNGRENLAITKTRGLISGGGRKPWKQKGTGRARFGSSRNPIWRGGGIVFGPTGEENYTKKLPVSSKRLAIRQALSLANTEGKITVIETFECKEGSTAQAAKLFEKIGAKRSVLLVVSLKDDLVIRATRNLQNVTVAQANYLNVYDIVNADTIVMSKKSVEIVEKWLTAALPSKASTATQTKEGAK